MAVIPGTRNIIVWDNNSANQALGTGTGAQWPQRYSVCDVETGVFTNHTILCPANWGDMFCAGHVWLPDGRLFVAGGNTRYPGAGASYYEGSKLAAIWNPATNVWQWLGAMRRKRWYPTVTLIVDYQGNHRVAVSGGVETTLQDCNNPDAAFNTYEVFDIGANDWERDTSLPQPWPSRMHGGPQGSNCFAVLGEYPRMHLVSNNQLFMVGMFRGASRVRHSTFPTQQNLVGDWIEPWGGAWDTAQFRDYGSSVLLPNVGMTPSGQDLIMILGGGAISQPGAAWNTSRIVDGSAAAPAWGAPETMVAGRMCANAVLLPTGEVLAIGGSADHYFSTLPNPTPVYDVDIYSKSTSWRVGAAQQSPRMYHSTAALLPSGRVVSAGGDIRSSDYELYSPKCVLGTRPWFDGTWAAPGTLTLSWNTLYQIQYLDLPVGVTISRVVFMRPCSVTHHSDMDQRYVELETVKMVPPMDNTIQVRTPSAPTSGAMRGSTVAPRGYYIAFLVATNGMVSEGKWVRLP